MVIDEKEGKKLKSRFFQTAESQLIIQQKIMREKTLPQKLNYFFKNFRFWPRSGKKKTLSLLKLTQTPIFCNCFLPFPLPPPPTQGKKKREAGNNKKIYPDGAREKIRGRGGEIIFTDKNWRYRKTKKKKDKDI